MSVGSSTSSDWLLTWPEADKTHEDEWNAVGQTMGNLNQEQEKVNQQTEAVDSMGSYDCGDT